MPYDQPYQNFGSVPNASLNARAESAEIPLRPLIISLSLAYGQPR